MSGVFLYFKQASFLFFPKKNTSHNGKDLFLKNDDVNIHVIAINEGQKKSIIYFGGNAETISDSVDYISEQFPEYSIYMMNYRSFGLSTGTPSEKGIFSDALKVYDYVSKKSKDISIGGRSLGSGVASYVASKREVRKLALITPFNSVQDVAQDRFKIFPMSILLKNKFKSESYVKNIKAKTMIFIAEEDTVIPLKYTERLINKFTAKQLEVITIKGRNHTDISSDEIYFRKMQDFVK